MKALRISALIGLALIPAVAHAPAGTARSSADCTVRSTGLVPLTDMARQQRYRGFPGGLYPGGANRPGQRYLRRGQNSARQVRQIRRRIGLVGIGTANAMAEFQSFARLALQDPGVNRSISFVDGPGGGWDAARVARPRSPYWTALDGRLRKAKLQRSQVQVIWLKESISGEDRAFPQDARALQAHLRSIIRIATTRFPNLRLVYVSSRTYAGYAVTHLNPEPFAYDSGFAVKWLVQAETQAKPGRVWVGWGPYLWTDGVGGRRDGLTWACEDVLEDGTHPSASGARKVARLLMDFFSADPTAQNWFRARI